MSHTTEISNKLTVDDRKSATLVAQIAMQAKTLHDEDQYRRALTALWGHAGYWKRSRYGDGAGLRMPPKMIRTPHGRSLAWDNANHQWRAVMEWAAQEVA